jgi:hypothetical protein
MKEELKDVGKVKQGDILLGVVVTPEECTSREFL